MHDRGRLPRRLLASSLAYLIAHIEPMGIQQDDPMSRWVVRPDNIAEKSKGVCSNLLIGYQLLADDCDVAFH